MSNTYERILLNVRRGTWPAVIDLSAGAPVAWWHVSDSFSAEFSNPYRKAGDGAIITVARIGSDAGFNDAVGNAVWSDGTAGTGSPTAHIQSAQVPGNGVRITCPVPRWPDSRILRVYTYAGLTQITHTVSMNDADAVTKTAAIGIAPEFGDLTGQGTALAEVEFASDLDGRTLTWDLVRNGASMGNFAFKAVQLFNAPATVFETRASAALRMMGMSGPLGSR